jgi:hypothetical protein
MSEHTSNAHRENPGAERISGLDPKFAVENRVNLCLNKITDIHTKWGYVRLDNVDPEELREQARELEEYAQDLQAAAEKYKDSEYNNETTHE